MSATELVRLDGPIGTELARRGIPTPAPGWSAYALDTDPKAVRELHAAYVAAGATVHRANTFRAQPAIFGDRHRALVARAVSLARDAGASRVAGSLAPIADCYRPDLAPPSEDARALHRTMATSLADVGVDLLVCETFASPREAVVAVEEAARTGLPVWLSLTAGPDGALLSPEALAAAAADGVRAGASALLVCCTDYERTLPYIEHLARVAGDVPFGAYANAGQDFGDARPRAVARYVACAKAWRAAGASIVGACCGTSPAHVAALAELA